ncbi:MAG: hypothetical protein Q8K92_23490, partial [Leadbetterella sp.]|nr:hypothetical protein [Leadbetterella sp.]
TSRKSNKPHFMKQLILIALIWVGIASTTTAQGFFQGHIGIAIPMGDFADDYYPNTFYRGSGYASKGFNLGLKYYSPLKYDGLSLVLSVNFFYNKLSKDFRNEYEDDYGDYNISFPKYLNVPILAGLNYSIPLKENLAFFGEGSIGVNMLKITNLKREGSYNGGNNYSTTIENFSPSVKVGYTIGGGILIQDKYRIGLNYYGLGSHTSNYNRKYISNYNSDKYGYQFEKSLNIKLFTLTIGIKI